MDQSSALKMPISLVFLRHARTPWNSDGLTMGQSDIPLSDLGKTEADLAATALQEYPIDMIVCSPLTRCLMTIAPFRATGDHEFVLEPKLAERAWGVYEGVPKSQRGVEKDPELGETEGEFRRRVTEALSALPIERNILLVSHSGVFREICNLGYIPSVAHAKLPHAIPLALSRVAANVRNLGCTHSN
ncbi:histidine phosphatase family protein [uncultured Tateyamaria sp.]|uniref:histidine phosphatase family protein n=2 Tax=Roseobacteraceae TaxID=2854170 RepID=UPI0034406C4B